MQPLCGVLSLYALDQPTMLSIALYALGQPTMLSIALYVLDQSTVLSLALYDSVPLFIFHLLSDAKPLLNKLIKLKYDLH